MGRILAIDFGTKRTGIAVTDPLRIIASGLTTVETPELLDFLFKYCSKEAVDCIVVGLPLYPDGNPAQIAPQADQMTEKIKNLFPEKLIVRQDERNTSNSARQVLLQSGIGRQKRQEKGRIDKVAAALILQQYMEENHW